MLDNLGYRHLGARLRAGHSSWSVTMKTSAAIGWIMLAIRLGIDRSNSRYWPLMHTATVGASKHAPVPSANRLSNALPSGQVMQSSNPVGDPE